MINYEEELKKFHPSLDVNEAEDAIYKRDFTDVTDILKEMIQEHVAYTNSEKGKEILKNLGKYLPKFKKIIPHDYKEVLQKISELEGKGLSNEQAQIEAFYQIKRG